MSSVQNPLVGGPGLGEGENGAGSFGSDDLSPSTDQHPMIPTGGGERERELGPGRTIIAHAHTQQEAEANLNVIVDSTRHSNQMKLRLWTFVLAVANAAGTHILSFSLCFFLSFLSTLN